MFYANSETILNNDRFFSPYIVESYPHQKEKSFNNYLLFCESYRNFYILHMK